MKKTDIGVLIYFLAIATMPAVALTTAEIVGSNTATLPEGEERALLPTIADEPIAEHYSEKKIQVPIVLYHHIRPITPDMNALAKGLSVTPEVFDRQLEYLEKNEFSTITLDQFYSALIGKESLPEKSIVLTFDDGYKDAYTYALPLLEKHHLKGVAFVITQAVGTSEYLTWDQIREMDKSGVFEIESHTLTHPELPKLSHKKMKKELEESKKILEEKIEKPIEFFCYPYGRYSKEIVKEAGYKGAFTTHYGTTHTLPSIFETTRVRLTNDDVGENFEKKIQFFFK